ncbi:nucleotidyltransferase domain-containing protein [Rossellomorea aquimaris]|nr:nucleotidyltransferase domain-containing protein [Rossellomorea vietnamensis]
MNQEVRDLLDQYTDSLKAWLPPELIAGSFLYGSLALGAYEEGRSDIDFLTVLSRDVTEGESKTIQSIHDDLRNHPLGKKMDGMYITESDLGKRNSEIAPYLFCQEGEIKRGHWDINAVTWFILKCKGIPLVGEHAVLQYQIGWDEVRKEMEYNINGYWKSKLNKQYLFLTDEWVEFAVCTVARILVTLEREDIVSKSEGLLSAGELVSTRWSPLFHEAVNLRMGKSGTSRMRRSIKTNQFLKEMISVCNERYFSG